MHPDGVARRRDSFQPLLSGGGGCAGPHHEKGGLDAVLLQNLQHPTGVGRGPVVKGEAAHLPSGDRLSLPGRGVKIGVQPSVLGDGAAGGGNGILLQHVDGVPCLRQLQVPPGQLGLHRVQLGLGFVPLPAQIFIVRARQRHVMLMTAVKKPEEGRENPQRRRQRRHGDKQGLGHSPGGGGGLRLFQLRQGRAQLLRPVQRRVVFLHMVHLKSSPDALAGYSICRIPSKVNGRRCIVNQL